MPYNLFRRETSISATDILLLIAAFFISLLLIKIAIFIAAFIVTSIACRLCFYCRLSLADVSMASAIDQTVYQMPVESMFLPGISF